MLFLPISVLFGDKEIADEIMAGTDPKVIKSLGRKVRNFDQEVWEEKCRGIVKDGNMAKVGIYEIGKIE